MKSAKEWFNEWANQSDDGRFIALKKMILEVQVDALEEAASMAGGGNHCACPVEPFYHEHRHCACGNTAADEILDAAKNLKAGVWP